MPERLLLVKSKPQWTIRVHIRGETGGHLVGHLQAGLESEPEEAVAYWLSRHPEQAKRYGESLIRAWPTDCAP